MAREVADAEHKKKQQLAKEINSQLKSSSSSAWASKKLEQMIAKPNLANKSHAELVKAKEQVRSCVWPSLDPWSTDCGTRARGE